MKEQYRKIKIFVASPSDVHSERDQLAKVIDELNRTISAIAPEKNVVLELIRWETHVHPALGNPQEVVNRQIGPYDIFIGVLWKRMGTPTATARSGTDEEFKRAYESWQQDKKLPVLFYFCQQTFPPPRTRDEVAQLGEVVDFRAELSNKGLVVDYADHQSFSDVVRPQLLLAIATLLAPQEPATQTAERIAQRASPAHNLHVRQQIAALAQEYEAIRATMDPGDARTRKMEAVMSRMRTLAFAGYSLLPELIISTSAGDRLMAVAILQSIPKEECFPWLSERLGLEKPFVGYHAAIALLAAVRTISPTNRKILEAAIAEAKKALKEGFPGRDLQQTDRYLVLDQAEHELRQQAGTGKS
jgi:hypothetical protein